MLFRIGLASVALAVAVRATHAQEGGTAVPPAAEIYLDEANPPPPPVIVGPAKLADKYADGSTRIEREVLKLSDDQIVNHGVFTEYYPKGQKFAEGHYVNGVHDGQWSFWHDNGQLCKTIAFKNGQPDGAWDVFRADGTMFGKRIYKEGQRDGTWISYHDDGKTPKIEDAYASGKHEGVSRVYFANGKPQREMSFKNGALEGPMTEWDESGRKTAEVNFKAGKRDGKFVLYRVDGTAVEDTYKDGRLVPEGAGG